MPSLGNDRLVPVTVLERTSSWTPTDLCHYVPSRVLGHNGVPASVER